MEKQLSRELRLLGLTREEVAKKLDITTTTLSNWVNGRYNISPVGVKMLQELGISKKAISDPSKEIDN